MAIFREVFKSKHVLLPVIHVKSEAQAIKNAKLAQDASCDGVILISMEGMPHGLLRRIHTAVTGELPDFWVGINYLGLPPNVVFAEHVDRKISGIWVDNAGIDETSGNQPKAEEALKARQRNYLWNGLYFGGVAFKYQRPVIDVGLVAKIARDYVDVVTTSGPTTGEAPDLDKVWIMKEAIGPDGILALASGISEANIEAFGRFASAFLFNTSVRIPGTSDFDPLKLRGVVKAIR